MSRRNRIPNEILERIIDYHEVKPSYVGNPSWKSINKQWFRLFQSKKYKSINIKLNNSDPTLNLILKSPFDPGFWVRNIDIMELKSRKSVNLKTDLLSRLMFHCPNAKNVYVHSFENKDWEYFYNVFRFNRHWNHLESLTRLMDPDDPSISRCYTDCLILLMKTLKHLVLTSGMINPTNCNLLTEFKSVEVLEIERDIVPDIYDCCDMIRLLPNLTRLTIVLSPLSILRIFKKPDSTILVKSNQSNVRALFLENFTPTEEKDLLFLMDQFPRLEELVIFGDKELPSWKLAGKVSLKTMKQFFEFIQRISSVKICISVNDCTWFLEQYYEYHDTLIRGGQHNPVRVTYCNDDPNNPDYIESRRSLIRGTEKYPIYVTLEDSNTEIILEFKDTLSEIDTLDFILTENNLCVKVLDIDMKSQTTIDDVGYCLETIIQYETHLQCLKFYFGRLGTYENTVEYKHKIRDLEFEKVLIKDCALKKAMVDFPYIRLLTFDRCVFKASDQSMLSFSFGLQNTSVGHLQIVYEKSFVSVAWIVFEVVQNDIDDVRYFLSPADNPTALKEINYADVFGGTNLLHNDLKIAVFNIYCKSIKYFTFRRIRVPYSEKDQMRIAF